MPEVDAYLVKSSLMGRDDECGDAGVIKESEGAKFLGLIDALGHGRPAHEVAMIAVDYLEQNHREPLTEMMQGLHACLKGTRGAVAAFCRLDLATGELAYVGMGNITVRVLGPRASRFVPRDGILGHIITKPREETRRLSAKDVLVMYSDGIREHFDVCECPGLLCGTAKTIAAELLRRFGKGSDDASCIVLRYGQ